MIYEDVSFGVNISDGAMVVGHCFVWRVSIRSTVKTLNDFPCIWTVRVGHCVLENIFPTFCLSLVDSLGSFSTSVNPLLAILMDRSTKVICCLFTAVWFYVSIQSHQHVSCNSTFSFDYIL